MTSIALSYVRVRHDHFGTIAITVTLAVATIGLALLLVPREGIDGAAQAWIAGNVLAAVVAVVCTQRARRLAVVAPA